MKTIENVLDAIDLRRKDKEFTLFKDDMMVIIRDFKKQFPKSSVLNAMRRYQESAFGVIVTWLRDYYHLPKTIGATVAQMILDRYMIDDNGNPIPKHATYKAKEFISQFILPSAKIRDEDDSVHEMINVIASDDLVDVFYTIYPNADDLDDRYDALGEFVQKELNAHIWPGELIL